MYRRDWELRAAQLSVVGGALAILVGTLLAVPYSEEVVLAGGGFTTIGALTFAMRLSNYRWEYPRELAAGGAGILLLFLVLMLVIPWPGQEPPRLVLLFSPAAFATGIVLLSTGVAVLWRRRKGLDQSRRG